MRASAWRGGEAKALLAMVNGIVGDLDLDMRSIKIERVDSVARVQFSVEASREEQRKVYERLRTSTGVTRVETIRVEDTE